MQLDKDILAAESTAKQVLTVSPEKTLTQYQYDLLISFIISSDSGTVESSDVVRLINAGKLTEVPGALQSAIHVTRDGQAIKSEYLQKRRQEEARLWVLKSWRGSGRPKPRKPGRKPCRRKPCRRPGEKPLPPIKGQQYQGQKPYPRRQQNYPSAWVSPAGHFRSSESQLERARGRTAQRRRRKHPVRPVRPVSDPSLFPSRGAEQLRSPGSANRLSDRGVDLVKSFEGLRLKAYLDSVGVPTIGYGHTKNVCTRAAS